mmetsp:Transcript_77273/g.214867  ORF Transcript_77273/g.214867 Transcript_77273/m.214867 type:complete len:200 (-) Transcript_77273:8-607(-)
MPFASLSPTPRRPRMTFRIAIFLSFGTSFSVTSNSVFSGAFSSSSPPPDGAAITTAPAEADASTPNVSSMAFTSSEASRSVRVLSSSTMASVLADCSATLGPRALQDWEGMPPTKVGAVRRLRREKAPSPGQDARQLRAAHERSAGTKSNRAEEKLRRCRRRAIGSARGVSMRSWVKPPKVDKRRRDRNQMTAILSQVS